jgi:twitching motility two-component system response regulator PilG
MSGKKKILAVDDENDILLIIKTALLSEGFDVTTAASGPEALTAMAEEVPDLVVLDMMMPEMTGFDVLAEMRKSSTLLTVPVIMLTGTTDKDKIREAIDVGVSYYIVKPFEFHDLISKVNLAIADAEQTAL